MRKVSVLLTTVFALSLATTAIAQSGRVQPTPTPTPDDEPLRIDTEEIKLNILATDANGKYLDDVKDTDIVITDNNILHQPSSIRRMPATVLIVMDTGGELRFRKSLDQTRETAAAVVAALGNEDNIAIMQYSDKAEVVEGWTTSKDAIMAAIGRTKFGRRSAFVEAIEAATTYLTESPKDNRHLVLITDGTDSFYGNSERAAAMKRIQSTDISVHVISYTRMELTDIEPRTKGISKSPPPKAMPDEIAATLPNGVRDVARAPKIGPTIILDRKHLKRMRDRKNDLESSEVALGNLSENTNGTIIIPLDKEEMITKTAAIARFIDSSYVLTYIPKIPVSESPVERLIVVTSKRPDLIVQAKRRFVVPRKR
jgi:Mg-chelatase subunit ChlD